MKNSPFNLNPRFGLEDITRLQALLDSTFLGVPKSATRNKVSSQSIYRWREMYHNSRG